MLSHQGQTQTFVSKNSWFGNALILGAVLCEAAYAVIGKHLMGAPGLNARRICALINAWGLVLMAPLALWAGWGFDFAAVSGAHWLLLLFYGLAASVGTVWLWMTGLKHVAASQAGVFTALLPLSTALTGVLFLGERLALWQGLAFAVALLGVVVTTWRVSPSSPVPAAESAPKL